jgi:N-acetylmuramoyl-L-alanine amidase
MRKLQFSINFFLISLFILSLFFLGCGEGKRGRVKKDSPREVHTIYIKVPSFDSLVLSEAKDLAQEKGFNLKVALGKEGGRVTKQLPPPGTKAEKGSTVWIWLEEIKSEKSLSSSKGDEKGEEESLRSSKSGRFIVCIDPGHQGRADLSLEPIAPGSLRKKEKCRGGTKGVSSGIPEYELNLRIGIKLKEELERKGIKVVMTREKNDVHISNRERAEIANEAKADIFVRLHFNGSGSKTERGFLILIPSRNGVTAAIYPRSKEAAVLIRDSYKKFTALPYEGIYERSDITGFNWSQVPSVLVELAYLTSPIDEELVLEEEFQEKMVRGLAEGILDFLGKKR